MKNVVDEFVDELNSEEALRWRDEQVSLTAPSRFPKEAVIASGSLMPNAKTILAFDDQELVVLYGALRQFQKTSTRPEIVAKICAQIDTVIGVSDVAVMTPKPPTEAK